MRPLPFVLISALLAVSATAARADEKPPAVVQLVSAKGPYCSGTLIGPRVVLTAAHCLDLDALVSVVADNETLAISRAEKHPQFDSTVFAHDVALLHLTTAAHAPPTTFASGPHLGERIRFVGFGNAGFQRVDSLNEWKFRGRPDPASPCGRDSGGGVFDERGALIGVISSGDLGCKRWALSTRVDAHRAFIDAGLPQPPAATGCSASPSSPHSNPALFVVGLLAAVAKTRLTKKAPSSAD